MFRALGAHIQEDTVVYMQHMVLSLSMRVRGGLSVHSLSENMFRTSKCTSSGRLLYMQSNAISFRHPYKQ